MFGGESADCSYVDHTRLMANARTAAPPQPSKKELEIAEAQTLSDIKWTAASAVVLYFCVYNEAGHS